MSIFAKKDMEYTKKLAYYNGIAAVQKNGKWGFVDRKDNIVIAFEYDELYQYHFDDVWFFNNRINISKAGKWGYINSKGEVIIPFIYDYAHSFENGLATVRKDDLETVIDIKGKLIFKNENRYNQVSAIDKSFFMVSHSSNGFWGVVDKKENKIVPFIYPFEDILAIEMLYNSSVKKSDEIEVFKKWLYTQLVEISVEKLESIVFDMLELRTKKNNITMRKQLTQFDIYDILNFPNDGELCQFNQFRLTKEEFLGGKYLSMQGDKPFKRILVYFIMPSIDEPTMAEIQNLLSNIDSDEVVWGCSSDNTITSYEVFLISIY